MLKKSDVLQRPSEEVARLLSEVTPIIDSYLENLVDGGSIVIWVRELPIQCTGAVLLRLVWEIKKGAQEAGWVVEHVVDRATGDYLIFS